MKIYYNPKCSTCVKTLAIINHNGIDPEIIKYLDNPLTLSELQKLFASLGLDSALPMVRVKDDIFKNSDLNENSSNNELLSLIANNPKLLQRPIVVTKNGALICRPPESVEGLL